MDKFTVGPGRGECDWYVRNLGMLQQLTPRGDQIEIAAIAWKGISISQLDVDGYNRILGTSESVPLCRWSYRSLHTVGIPLLTV